MSTVALPAPRRRPPGWIRVLRPHYIPLTLGPGMVGMVIAADDPTTASIAIGLAVLVLAYGLGQVLNDYFDRHADRINAPDRPLVSGEVDANRALLVSSAVTGALWVAALIVAPPMLVWMGVAVVGHLLYTVTKRVPLLGNIVNGADVAVITMVGAAAAAPERSAFDLPTAVWVDFALFTLVLTGFGMVTYFKDFIGDTAVGYRTFVVAMGPQRARWLPPLLPIAAVAIAVVLGATDPGSLGADSAGPAFWVLLALSAVTFALGSRLLLADPDANAFSSIGMYTRGCVAFAFAVGAAHDPVLFVLTFVPVAALLELGLADALRDNRRAAPPTTAGGD